MRRPTTKHRRSSKSCGLARWARELILLEHAVHETLTYYGFPDILGEDPNRQSAGVDQTKEIRRRTRVVGAFPDGPSCSTWRQRTARAVSPANRRLPASRNSLDQP